MGARFVPNAAGIAQVAMLTLSVITDLTEEGAEIARNTAPILEGWYYDSIETQVVVENGVPHGLFYSTDFKAGFLEFGTSDTPTFGTLGSAAEALSI